MSDRKQTENKFRRIIGALGGLSRHPVTLSICVLILLIPFPTTVVPEWRVRVVGPDGKPASGVWVRQAWKHYSLDLDAAENFDERGSDENGYAVFPRKTISKGLLHRAGLIFVTGLLTLAHGSTGVRASVWAVTGKCSSKFLDYHSSQSLPDTLMLSCAE